MKTLLLFLTLAVIAVCGHHLTAPRPSVQGLSPWVITLVVAVVACFVLPPFFSGSPKEPAVDTLPRWLSRTLAVLTALILAAGVVLYYSQV